VSPRLTAATLAALGGLLVHSAGGGAPFDGWLMDRVQAARRAGAVRPVRPQVALVGVAAEAVARWPADAPGLLRALDLGRAEAVGFLPPLAGGHAGLVLQPPFERGLGLVTGREPPGPALAPATLRTDPDGRVRRLALQGAGGRASLVVRLAGSLGVASRPGFVDYALGRPFDYDPLESLVRWEQAGDWEALEGKLRGRPILVAPIGGAAARRAIPLALAGWEGPSLNPPEVIAHAQALRTLIADRALVATSPVAVGLLVVLAASVTALVRRLRFAIPVGVLLGLGLWSGELWLLDRGAWLPASAPLVALALGWSLAFVQSRR